MTGRLRVKICGLTRLEDATLAVAAGADAVGFVFWPKSPRAISPAAAAEISRRLPSWVTRVGVCVDASPDEVEAIVAEASLDVAQLHGGEVPERYRGRGARLMKVVTLASDVEVDEASYWPPDIMPLVDAADPVRKGGTGQRANWARAAILARRRPIVLAGGISAESVVSAVGAVRPWGIDVSSGVESAPGIKSAERIASLMNAVDGLRTEDV